MSTKEHTRMVHQLNDELVQRVNTVKSIKSLQNEIVPPQIKNMQPNSDYFDRAITNLLSCYRKNLLGFLDEIKRQARDQEEKERLERLRDRSYSVLGDLTYSLKLIFQIEKLGGEIQPFGVSFKEQEK